MAKRPIGGCRTILTGASSGIGRELAVGLVREGASVLAVARRADELASLAQAVAELPGQFQSLAGDITSPEVRTAAIEQAQSCFGGLDLLVNNAGIGAMGPFAEAAPERLRQVMEVNFFAAAEMIRLAVPLLEQGNRPMVVNVSSILGHRGIANCAEYCASKFALQGLSESLRAELAGRRIDLLVVSPGTTQTGFFDAAIDSGNRRRWGQRGMTAAAVARRTVAAIRAGRHEIVISASGKLLVWMNRLMPRVVDRLVARYR